MWLLSLPENHYHRLGGGKPLGFGSVRLELDNDNSIISSGNEMKNYYSDLTIMTLKSDIATEDAKREFEDKVKETYGNENEPDFIKAFLVASKGFPGGHIYYPRMQRDKTKDIFEWFGMNENGKTGKDKYPLKLSLPALQDNNSKLPNDPTESRERQNNSNASRSRSSHGSKRR